MLSVLYTYWMKGEIMITIGILFWFEENDMKAPYTDTMHKGGAVQVRKNGDVVVYCR